MGVSQSTELCAGQKVIPSEDVFVKRNASELLELLRGLQSTIALSQRGHGNRAASSHSLTAHSVSSRRHSTAADRRASQLEAGSDLANEESTATHAAAPPARPLSKEDVFELFSPYQHLRLANHYLGDASLLDPAYGVLPALAANRFLTSLDLSWNQLTGASIGPLLTEALWPSSPASPASSPSSSSAASPPKSFPSHSPYSPKSIAVSAAPHTAVSSTLQWLSLAGNAVTVGGGVPVLARWLAADPSVEVLSLYHCGLRDADVAQLCDGLAHNTHLRVLQLDLNDLTSESVERLLKLVREENAHIAVVLLRSTPYDAHTFARVPIDLSRRVEYACTSAGAFPENSLPSAAAVSAASGPTSSADNANGASAQEEEEDGQEQQNEKRYSVAAQTRVEERCALLQHDLTGLSPLPADLLSELEDVLAPRRAAYVSRLAQQRATELAAATRAVVGAHPVEKADWYADGALASETAAQAVNESCGKEEEEQKEEEEEAEGGGVAHNAHTGETNARSGASEVGHEADDERADSVNDGADASPLERVGRELQQRRIKYGLKPSSSSSSPAAAMMMTSTGTSAAVSALHTRRGLPPIVNPVTRAVEEAYRFRRTIHGSRSDRIGEKTLPNGFDRIWMAPIKLSGTRSVKHMAREPPRRLRPCWCEPYDAALPYAGTLHYHCQFEECIDYGETSNDSPQPLLSSGQGNTEQPATRRDASRGRSQPRGADTVNGNSTINGGGGTRAEHQPHASSRGEAVRVHSNHHTVGIAGAPLSLASTTGNTHPGDTQTKGLKQSRKAFSRTSILSSPPSSPFVAGDGSPLSHNTNQHNKSKQSQQQHYAACKGTGHRCVSEPPERVPPSRPGTGSGGRYGLSLSSRPASSFLPGVKSGAGRVGGGGSSKGKANMTTTATSSTFMLTATSEMNLMAARPRPPPRSATASGIDGYAFFSAPHQTCAAIVDECCAD